MAESLRAKLRNRGRRVFRVVLVGTFLAWLVVTSVYFFGIGLSSMIGEERLSYTFAPVSLLFWPIVFYPWEYLRDPVERELAKPVTP